MYKGILRLSFMFLALGVLTGCLWFYHNSYAFPQGAPPRIVAAQRPESPLFIEVTFVDSSNPLQPKYEFSITNRGDKPISAYAIQEVVSLGPGSPITSTKLVHFPAIKLLLNPHESMQDNGGYGKTYRQAPVEISLIVDFVEFADGTRCGDDIGRSGEKLDGQRAGGTLAIRKYREILANEGMNGFEQALANPNLTTLIGRSSALKSDNWIDGFNMGVNIVKHRLAAAKLKGGENQVRQELSRPFDSTEGRQEP